MELITSIQPTTAITFFILIILSFRFSQKKNWIILFELAFLAIAAATFYAAYERYNKMEDILFGIDVITLSLYFISALCVVTVIVIEVKKAFHIPDNIQE